MEKVYSEILKNLLLFYRLAPIHSKISAALLLNGVSSWSGFVQLLAAPNTKELTIEFFKCFALEIIQSYLAVFHTIAGSDSFYCLGLGLHF